MRLKNRREKIAAAALLLALLLSGCIRSAESRRARHLEAGRKFLAAKDHARAILEFKNALALKADDPEAHYQLGLAYLASGDWALASAHLQKATALNPKHAGAQLRYAEMLALTDNPALLEEARKRLEGIFGGSPGNAEALTALAIAEWKLAQPEQAEKHLREAFLKSPGNLSPAVALAKIKIAEKRFDEAEQVLRQAASSGAPLALIALGEFYLLRERTPEAQQLFERALQADPKQPVALAHLGAIHVRAGKLDAADGFYRRLAALDGKQYKPVHAIFLFETGKKDEAIAEFRRLYEQNRSDITLRDHLLAALIWSERLAEAEKLLNQVLAKGNSDIQALLQRAALYLTLQRYEDAEKDLHRVQYLQSNSAEAQYLFAKLHEARGHVMSQRQALNEALRLRPSLLVARLELARLMIGRNAARTALQVIEETPKEQKNLLAVVLERNWALLALGENAAVEASLAGELKSIPSPDVAVLAAMLRLVKGKTAEARKLAEKALEQRPDDLRALEIISRSYAREKKMDAAVRELALYAAKRPKSAALQQFLGNVLLSYGRREEARAAFTQALAVKPGHTESELALIQMDIHEGKLTEAHQALERMLQHKGENVFARLWLANLDLLEGKAEAAMANYRRVLEFDPNQLNALNNLAYLLAEEGKNPDLALGYAQKAAELAPDNAAVQNTLGWVLYKKGMYSMAVRHLERAVATENNAKRSYHLALAYLRTGDKARAQRALQTVLRQHPDSPEAKQAKQLMAQ